ncbi:LysR family transcriptional regulator [Bordetella bronchiseptica]|uniref:LysR family transcriptional regulator n=1 Tax=Bordetella bronchiseptica TaxID=518 RepID=UPI0002DAE8BA|nr:LysR substrate-binding domain-containing protein [Bordetella bronchiseptica]
MDESWLGVLRRINLNQLASFAAVADRGSFRAAAAQLHISQSALSVQVQQLEAALGVKLLHRDTRTVRLTDEGRRLEQVFSLSGRELARVLAQLRDEGRLQKGAIVLAVLPSLAATFLPPLMRAFQARFPGIRIRMHDADSRRAHEQIQQGAVDIAVTSRSPHNEEVGFQPLFEEPLLAVVPAADALFRSRASASLELLARRPLLLNPRGVDLRERLETLFRAAGIAAAPAPAPPHPPPPPHPAHPAHPTFPPASTAEFQPTTGIRTPSCCIQAAINPLRPPKTELFLN